MSSISARRLQKELKELHGGECPVGKHIQSDLIFSRVPFVYQMLGVTLLKADDFETWYLGLEVLGESVYRVWSLVLVFRIR